MKTETKINLNEINKNLIAAGNFANSQGATPSVAWMRIREIRTELRAPYWASQIGRNTGCRRDYRSPLGQALGVVTGNFGSHSAKYPRTKCSEEVESEMAVRVCEELKRLASLPHDKFILTESGVSPYSGPITADEIYSNDNH